SNTRKCICGPTKVYPRLALRSAVTWTFIMADVPTRALTAARPIKPTSPRCHSAWQPNPGRGSTYRRGKSVQTTGTSCECMSVQTPERSDSVVAFAPKKGHPDAATDDAGHRIIALLQKAADTAKQDCA